MGGEVEQRLRAAGHDPKRVATFARDLFENYRLEVEDDSPWLRWDGLTEAQRNGWYRAALFAMAYARLSREASNGR